MFTPAELRVLLHCHFNAEQNNGLERSKTVIQALDRLEGLGMVEKSQIVSEDPCIFLHRTTGRGKAYVNMLCQTPLPEPRWVDPRSGEEVQDNIHKQSRMVFP